MMVRTGKVFNASAWCTALQRAQAQYRGSWREEQDLLSTCKCEGRMRRLFQYVMCSDAECDSHRFMDIIEKAIEEGVWCLGAVG